MLRDIVTGFDDQQHVYRYQAVAVNLLLLAAEIGDVVHSLELPVFDNTWLGLPGLSGATSALGKQIVEKK